MGEELVQKTDETPTTLNEYFHELFAWSIQLGMTYEQFWEYDPLLIIDYIKAEEIRQRKLNNQLWLEGIYFQQAIASCFSKKCKYPKQPIPMTYNEIEEKREARFQAFETFLINKSQKKEK